MLGGALEARRGRGEHTAEGARRLSGNGWRSSAALRSSPVQNGKHRISGWKSEFPENLIVGIPPLGSGFFQTGVRRRKYKLGPTKKFPVQIFASLARVYISSSSPQSERIPTPGGGFLRSD